MPRQVHRGRSHCVQSRSKTKRTVEFSMLFPHRHLPQAQALLGASPELLEARAEDDVYSLPVCLEGGGERYTGVSWGRTGKGWPPMPRAVCPVALSLPSDQTKTSF